LGKLAEEEDRQNTIEKEEKEEDEKNKSEKDLFDIGPLQFKFKLSPEEEELELKIRKERRPAYKQMVLNTHKV
jgi:hypothetical protein